MGIMLSSTKVFRVYVAALCDAKPLLRAACSNPSFQVSVPLFTDTLTGGFLDSQSPYIIFLDTKPLLRRYRLHHPHLLVEVLVV